MKKLLAVLVFISLNSVCMGTCREQIKVFYTAYLNNLLQDGSQNTVLCRTYFTEELIEKVERLGNATGADPVIRAQDTNPNAIETLSVEELGDGWYSVRYFWVDEDPATITEIPVKTQDDADGNCKISYITPVWNGSRYGDELLACAAKTSSIDHRSELSFLQSFYDAYLSEYCSMPKDLYLKLSCLRSRYLSAGASEQFERAESENLSDGLSGYDLLIDNFDFDCLWCKDVEFKHLGGNNYQITYPAGDRVCKIAVIIKRGDGHYLIDSVSI